MLAFITLIGDAPTQAKVILVMQEIIPLHPGRMNIFLYKVDVLLPYYFSWYKTSRE
jgi:hypothetical protein